MYIHETDREIAIATKLLEIKGLIGHVPCKQLIRRMASLCDTELLPKDHPLRRDVGQMQSHYKRYGGLEENDLKNLCTNLANKTSLSIQTLTVKLGDAESDEPKFIKELREAGFQFDTVDHGWKPKDRNAI